MNSNQAQIEKCCAIKCNFSKFAVLIVCNILQQNNSLNFKMSYARSLQETTLNVNIF